MKEQMAAAHLDEKIIARQRAIISSMTPKERRNPDMLKASRKKRIAAGSGTKVEDVNRLLKQHRQMADMMKAMGQSAGKRGPMAKLGQMLGLGGGMPMPTQEQIEAMRKEMGGKLPGLPGGGSGSGIPDAPPPGLFNNPPPFPGLGGIGGLGGAPKLPGLGGAPFNPFGGKKK
jgi:signal recognition particle subunit SRP54